MNKIQHFLLKAGVGVILIVLLIVAGGPGATVPNHTPASAAQANSELVIGHPVLPTGLDPVMDGSLLASSAYLLIFDRLIEVDETGQLVPSIALSWTAVEDTVWEIKIREGVHFHNGEVLDAEDVAFSLQHAAFDEDVSLYTAQYGKLIASIDVIDPTTVHIVTTEPWALCPARLVLLRIIPKDYFEEVGGAAAFSEAPVGSGPYKVVDWEIDNFIQMERFEDYWKGASGPEKVTMRLMGEESSRVNALEAGEVNVATIIDPEQAIRLEGDGFQLISVPTGQLFIYFFRPTLGGPIADERVRLAINLAVDVDSIIDALFFGTTEALQGQPATPAIDGFNPDIAAYGYDPDRARTLLADAGYGDGITLTLDTTSGRAPKDQETAEIIAAMLADVGITVNININEWGVYLDKLFNAGMGDMWSLSLNAAPSMTLENPSFNFTSFTGHKSQADPDYDALQARWSQTFDPEERAVLAHEMLQYIHDQAWGLFLWQVPGVHVAAPNVEGFQIGPDYKIDLSNVVIRSGE
jgi:peptide/nickel transport system substrate-binding protein